MSAKSMAKHRFIPALSALILMGSCGGEGGSDPAVGACVPVRERYLLGGRLGDTIRHFGGYDLETRYRIYICANQGTFPAQHFGLESEFAEGGEDAAHFLAAKLDDATYDLTIYDIVVVFAVMQSMRTYDATTDPALMVLIEQKVSQLEGALRESGEMYLETIRSGPGTPLPG
jgi:hypothetical protein